MTDLGSRGNTGSPATTLPSDDLPPQAPPSIHRILDFVASKYGLSSAEVTSDCRSPKYLEARHVGIFISFRLSQRSSPRIGRVFKRDHTSCLYARNRIYDLMDSDPAFKAKVEAIQSEFMESLI